MRQLVWVGALLCVAACGGGASTDAGTDATVGDAGGSDAGAGDSGSDAGGMDAGGDDAGGHDAGSTDLGFDDGSCDADHDGHAAMNATCGGDDCDDTNASVHPTQVEVCNGVDDNCDGSIDEGVTTTFYRDMDGDLHGDATMTTQACSVPTGYASVGDDCDDAHGAVHPGAMEICDGIDNDCDGIIDPGCACTDGSVRSCGMPGRCAAGTQLCIGGAFGACSVSPVPESCNGLDDDCDGVIDNGVTITCFVDGDGDSYAAPGAATSMVCPDASRPLVGGCPFGYTNRSPGTAGAADCDDANALVSPGRPEYCNGVDDNCNGMVDEGVTTTYYRDADGDGHGNPTMSVMACSAPAGYTVVGNDCDDTRPNVYPGAVEICDLLDNNCNGLIDEGCP